MVTSHVQHTGGGHNNRNTRTNQSKLYTDYCSVFVETGFVVLDYLSCARVSKYVTFKYSHWDMAYVSLRDKQKTTLLNRAGQHLQIEWRFCERSISYNFDAPVEPVQPVLVVYLTVVLLQVWWCEQRLSSPLILPRSTWPHCDAQATGNCHWCPVRSPVWPAANQSASA